MDKNGNKTGGRAIGTPNKSSSAIRENLNVFINANIDEIQAMYNNLDSDKDRFTVLFKMLEYALPKIKTESIQDDNQNVPDIVALARQIIHIDYK